MVVVTRQGGREVKYDTDERRKVSVSVVFKGEGKEGDRADVAWQSMGWTLSTSVCAEA